MRGIRMLTLLCALSLVASCDLLGGKDESSGSSANLGRLTVAIIPVLDSAPLQYAIETGEFQKAGLDVKTITVGSGSDSVTRLTSGEAEISYGSYTPFFLANSKRTADLKIIADGSEATSGTQSLMVPEASPIHHVRDLKGKRIAVTAKNTMSHLLIASLLRDNDVDPNAVEWQEMSFDKMAPSMQRGQTDAAYMNEPYVELAKQGGMKAFCDAASGPTANMPLTGYAALTKTIQARGPAIAAFQRVLSAVTQRVVTNPSLVEATAARVVKANIDTIRNGGKPRYRWNVPAVDRVGRVLWLMLLFVQPRIDWFDVQDILAGPLP